MPTIQKGQSVLVCDYVQQELLNSLEQIGFHVVYAPEIPNEKIGDWFSHVVGIIVNTRTPVREILIDRCTKLLFIGRLGAGLDIIDTEIADHRGIAVINTPGANANAVAEHMFGMLLALFRKIPAANKSVKEGKWLRERHRGREIMGLTIGVIGFGHTGSAFGLKFANWMTDVVAYDKYKTHYADNLRFIEETTLQDVIERSDVISFHVPLTDITMGMVNQKFLNSCKKGVVILNGSRGKVVDLKSLIDALDSGQVGGACLDVLENEGIDTYNASEKAQFATLRNMDNVILSPHIAGWTVESKANIARQMFDGILDFFNINSPTY